MKTTLISDSSPWTDARTMTGGTFVPSGTYSDAVSRQIDCDYVSPFKGRAEDFAIEFNRHATTVSLSDALLAIVEIAKPREVARLTPSDLVNSVHLSSGLTWEQIASALGVSRRSLHLWAGGGAVSGRNLEALVSFNELVMTHKRHTPELTRSQLLFAEGGLSPLNEWLRQRASQTARVNAPTMTAAELMG